MTGAASSSCGWLRDHVYTATFYSFKGGVGRTMALVNTAVDLANRGRRVLVVDFDLEAPGLDTFDATRPRDRVHGIVDFVGEYLSTGQAPVAERFISEVSFAPGGTGKLWIMPSGRVENYSSSYNEIDWGGLYAERDGFLLFEDLRAQWRALLQPDYVLIDSRTGHTDTGGICTRQLPNAVVILFFPNEQNLRGLIKVVRDIRSEAREPHGKRIDLHFVMSNVPDLDDEDRILGEKKAAFQKQLRFEHEPLIVHRYDSLSLLNQVVFVKDRPRSRLATEYRRITREIARRNTADRDGALDYIRRMSRPWRRRNQPDSILTMEDRLGQIEKKHPEDGELLFHLAECWERNAEPDRAATLLNRAVETGYEDPLALLKRARLRASREDYTGASEDATRLLDSDEASPPMVADAIRMLKFSTPEQVAASTAVRALEAADRNWLAGTLNRSRNELEAAYHVLRIGAEPAIGGTQSTDAESASESGEDAVAAGRGTREYAHVLSLICIGTGRFAQAMGLLLPKGMAIGNLEIDSAFNYGMALWGETGTLLEEPFLRVIELDRDKERYRGNAREPENDSANYFQRMSIACWATGDRGSAVKWIEQACQAIEQSRRYSPGRVGTREFSCWRYCVVNADRFASDMEEIRALVEGDGSRKPRFMTPRIMAGLA